MNVPEPANVQAPIETCPQCGARLVVLRGDGVIETTCERCEYVVRQHPARNVPHVPYELGPAIPRSSHPFSRAVREKPHERRAIHKAWFIGWAIAIGAILTCVVGVRDYLPIYLASRFLIVFGAALAVHRILHADREGQRWPEGVMWHMAIFLSAYALGLWLATKAPAIGEPNYCPATTATMLMRQVPHTFRCTAAPVWFAGFVAGFWILGWIAMWLRTRLAESRG